MKSDNTHMLRAGQVAKRAGVSTATIKHYVNEGLIPKPLKTGKTMAYYDETCVDRIKLIKKLQKEKFLPLDVIKRVLDSGTAYEEELELGQAILKSYKMPSDTRLIGEARIERHTRYPLEKIRVLEKEGLILPAVRDGVKQYDAIDCSIIEMVKRREELGLPFDHSIETIRLYRDAIRQAVKGDMRLFARNLLGDASAKQTIKFLTEVDDTLDNFMVLIRQKMLRSLSEAALAQMNDLPARLAALSFLPVQGKELPEAPPEDMDVRIIYLFLTGAYDSVIAYIEDASREHTKPLHAAASILANLLRGDSEAALRITEQRIPKPTARALDNAAAGLAYMFSVGEASGFSGPMFLIKKALGYFRRIETSRRDEGLIGLLCRYICGAVYTMLPDILDTCETGVQLLTSIEKTTANRKAKKGELPGWLARTLDYELLPAIDVRVNRFLAECFLRQGYRDKARESLLRIIESTDAEDEHSQWARMKRLETGARPTDR